MIVEHFTDQTASVRIDLNERLLVLVALDRYKAHLEWILGGALPDATGETRRYVAVSLRRLDHIAAALTPPGS